MVIFDISVKIQIFHVTVLKSALRNSWLILTAGCKRECDEQEKDKFYQTEHKYTSKIPYSGVFTYHIAKVSNILIPGMFLCLIKTNS